MRSHPVLPLLLQAAFTLGQQRLEQQGCQPHSPVEGELRSLTPEPQTILAVTL